MSGPDEQRAAASGPGLGLGAALLALTAAGLLLRLAATPHTRVISRDGIAYLELARLLSVGEWGPALDHHYPPGYPLAIAAAGALLGGVSEAAATWVSALASAASIPLVGVLTARAFGARAAAFAALGACCSPLLVELGAEVLADALYMALGLGCLVASQHVMEGRRGRVVACWAAATLGVGAYLTRPEGIVVLAVALAAAVLGPRAKPAARGARRRLAEGLLLIAPAALLALPYLLAIQERAILGGADAGQLKLTLKRDLAAHLFGLDPVTALGRLLEQLRLTLKAIGPIAPLLLLAPLRRGAGAPGPLDRGAPRRLSLLLVGAGLGLLTAFVVVRTDRRYGAPLALLALPWVGLGATRASAWLRARASALRARWGPRPQLRGALGLAAAVIVVSAPLCLRDRHGAKVSYVEAGRLLAGAGARRVLALDSRAGYYGAAEPLPLLVLLPDPAAQTDAAALLRVAREQRADAIVVIAQGPGLEASRALEASTGVKASRVRLVGAVPLDLFLLEERR